MQKRKNERKVSCEKEIIRTLSYRAVFQYPLSFYQLGTFLLCESPRSFDELKDALGKLCDKGTVRTRNGRYFLKNVKPVDWDKKYKTTQKIIESHKKTFKVLSRIPWIRLIAVTGAAAAYNSKLGDDLDIFVITSRNRLWITRFFVVLLLKTMGVYRTDEDPGNKICPNLLISEDAMFWDDEKHNEYIAHEIVMMRPILDRSYTYMRFIKANDWVSKYFGNITINPPENIETPGIRRGRVINILEPVFMYLQRIYMKKKITTEVATKNIIHFNKNDSGVRILTRYRKLLKKSP